MPKLYRATDPVTSKIAALGLSSDYLNRTRRAVIGYLLEHGECTQEQAALFLDAHNDITPQRTRTVMSDLHKAGVLVKTGRTQITRRGRRAHVYALAEKKEQ